MTTRIAIILGLLLLSVTNYAQKSTIENINDATRNVLDIFKKTPAADKEKSEDIPSGSFKRSALDSEKSLSRKGKTCKVFCVENSNKKAAKIDLEFRDTKEKQSLLVMSRDKSCLFDIPLGIYIVRVYMDDRLVKKTDYNVVEEDQETLAIPE